MGPSEFEVSIRGKGSSCPRTQNAGNPSQGSDRLAVCLQYPYQSGCYTNLFKDGCRVSSNEGRPAFTGSDRCSAQCNKHGEAHFRAACRKGCEFMACSSDWAVRAGCKLVPPVQWDNGVADNLFTSYRGQWNLVGQAVGQMKLSASTSWSTSEARSVSSQFSVGLEVSASAGFFGVEVSTTASTEWSRASESTVENIKGGASSSTCGSLACTGNLYQWAIVGTRRDGGQETMQQCSFVCVHSDSSASPKCPSRYCASSTGDESNTINNCQCCNSHCWAPSSDQAKDLVCPRLSANLNNQCSDPSAFSWTRQLSLWVDAQTAVTAASSAPTGATIRSKHGICLDANQRKSNGGLVQMWTCDADHLNQQWTYTQSTGQIKSVDGLCLDASERSKQGGKVHMWTCNTNNKNQQWTYNGQTGQIKARHGICLDASERSKQGGKVHMWTCDTNNKNQQWAVPVRVPGRRTVLLNGAECVGCD